MNNSDKEFWGTSCRDLSQKFKPVWNRWTSCRDQTLVPATGFWSKMASAHNGTYPCDLLQGLVPLCVLTFSRFSPVMWSKLKVVTIPWIKSRIWDTIDWYINNLAKNPVSAVFHLHAICRNVTAKFIELCMETPCLSPSEGHKHGGRKVRHLSLSFAIETKNYCSRTLTHWKKCLF